MSRIKITAIVFVIIFSLPFCATVQEPKSEARELDPEYQYDKAVVAYRYGLPDEALKYLQRTLELAPEHASAYNLLGLIYFDKGNLSQALGYYRKAVELNPQLAEAYYGLGRVYEELGEEEKARQAYQEAYRLNPTAEFALAWAKSLYLANKYEEALAIVNKLLDSRPSTSAYNLQGVLLNHLGRYQEAVTSFEQALRLSPEDEVAAVNLGVALVNWGQKEKAKAWFEQLLPRLKNAELKARVADFIKQLQEK